MQELGFVDGGVKNAGEICFDVDISFGHIAGEVESGDLPGEFKFF